VESVPCRQLEINIDLNIDQIFVVWQPDLCDDQLRTMSDFSKWAQQTSSNVMTSDAEVFSTMYEKEQHASYYLRRELLPHPKTMPTPAKELFPQCRYPYMYGPERIGWFKVANADMTPFLDGWLRVQMIRRFCTCVCNVFF